MQRDFEFAAQALARLAPCGDGWIAFPPHTTLEIVDHPQPVAVPGAAPHALGLMEWQGRRIALIDAAALLGFAPPRTSAPRYGLVLALQTHDGAAIEHGAIALDALPETITVTDDDTCTLPADAAWRRVSLACIAHQGRPVPIVDTAALFAAS